MIVKLGFSKGYNFGNQTSRNLINALTPPNNMGMSFVYNEVIDIRVLGLRRVSKMWHV